MVIFFDPKYFSRKPTSELPFQREEKPQEQAVAHWHVHENSTCPFG
jgi:hypothetical protein